MDTFPSPDGTLLAVHEVGSGNPLVCLPGGPMKASAYLGDLGGLSAHRSLRLLDLRGTGDSHAPADATSYQVGRQVGDLEALRSHIGLERMDLLAHSAGAALALQYATQNPERIGRIVLICPTPKAVGLEVTDEERRETAELRRDEPWFPGAFSAFERIWAGQPTDEDWDAITPFLNGRWDAARHAQAAEEDSLDEHVRRHRVLRGGCRRRRGASGRLSRSWMPPVLVVAGQFDVALPPARAAEYAELFPQGRLFVAPRGRPFAVAR